MRNTDSFKSMVAGFGMVVALFCVIALVVGQLVSDAHDSLEKVVGPDFEGIRRTESLMRAIGEAEISLRGHERTNDPALLQAHHKALSAFATHRDVLLVQMSTEPEEVHARLAALVHRLDTLFGNWARAAREDTYATAAEEVAAMTEVHVAWRDLLNAVEYARTGSAATAVKRLSRITPTLWATNGFAALATILLAALLARRVLRDYERLALAAEQVAHGRFGDLHLPRGRDAARVSQAFSRMVTNLSERDRVVAALNAASRALSEHVRLPEALEPFVAALQDVLPVSDAAIFAVDEDGTRVLGMWPHQTEELEPLTEEERRRPSVAQKCFRERVPQVSNDCAAGEWLESGVAVRRGLSSCLYVPLVLRDQTIGVVAVGCEQPDAYGPEHAEMLQTLAGQIAGRVALSELNSRLDEKNAELARASSAKSDFLAMMSHELRTPLNAIIGFSEVLGDQAFGPLNDRQATYVRNVLDSGRHLLRLINDVLDLSKIEAGRLEIRREPCAALDLCQAAMTIVQPAADRKRLVLTARGDALLDADPVRSRQVLFNLLSNAVKFTPDGGRIDVQVEERGEQAVISVTDTGIGISEDDQSRLFSAFTQLDRPQTRTVEGTGLGLALTKRLLELQDGTIEVESTPGHGSTFRITLPLARTRRNTGSPSGPSAGDGPLVLVIDDEAGARELLSMALTQSGYRVMEADTAEEGFALAMEHRPAAITLDLVLPGMDGWELLRKLKTEPATATIPVLIVTIRDDGQKGLVLGASECLTKPVDRDRLVSALRRCGITAPGGLVLAVDDDPDALALYETVLASVGYRLIRQTGGPGAASTIREIRPDLVLLDLLMPGVNGFDVLDRLSELPGRPVPVVVITGKTLTDEDRARLAKAAAIIEKTRMGGPTELRDMLLSAIDGSLKRRQVA